MMSSIRCVFFIAILHVRERQLTLRSIDNKQTNNQANRQTDRQTSVKLQFYFFST